MELSDAKALLAIENNPLVWQYTRGSDAPYTLVEIEEFITAFAPFEKSGQVRFLIDLYGRVIGTADLYDYNVGERSAWCAILIYPFELRGCGYGGDALKQLIGRAAVDFGLLCVKAEIEVSNAVSLAVFRKCGFVESEQRGRHILMYNPLAELKDQSGD